MKSQFLRLLAVCFVLTLFAGCQPSAPSPSPSLENLSPEERQAIDLAQEFLAKQEVKLNWGKPDKVQQAKVESIPGMKGKDVFVVTYSTPPDEVKVVGDRAIVADIKTGRVAFLPRD